MSFAPRALHDYESMGSIFFRRFSEGEDILREFSSRALRRTRMIPGLALRLADIPEPSRVTEEARGRVLRGLDVARKGKPLPLFRVDKNRNRIPVEVTGFALPKAKGSVALSNPATCPPSIVYKIKLDNSTGLNHAGGDIDEVIDWGKKVGELEQPTRDALAVVDARLGINLEVARLMLAGEDTADVLAEAARAQQDLVPTSR